MDALVRRRDIRQNILAAVSKAYQGPGLSDEEVVAASAGARAASDRPDVL